MQSSVLDPEMEWRLKNALEFTDDDYVEVLSQVFNIAGDDPRWTSIDANGNTVLHFAAAKVKPKSVQWILDRDKVLSHHRNFRGETPLEALLANSRAAGQHVESWR